MQNTGGQSYEDLEVWQRGIAMVREVYQATAEFPREEIYGLTSQIRRAAVSVPSNIAEGHGRQSRGEFRQFLGQARGSVSELETQIVIARDLGFMGPDQADAILDELRRIGRMLSGLIRSIRRASSEKDARRSRQ